MLRLREPEYSFLKHGSDTYDRDLSKYAGQEIEFVITEFNQAAEEAESSVTADSFLWRRRLLCRRNSSRESKLARL